MSVKVDLTQLAVDRSQSPQPPAAQNGGRWVSRYLLPLAIVVAFAGLFGWSMKDSLLPATPVTVVPVVVAQAEVQQADTPLFQAAGWVEPCPIPIVVSSLAEGVIEELYVVAGQTVAKGEVIARLIAVDARIARDEARAEVRLLEAELAAAEAERENAQLALERPVQLQADLAEAESALIQLESQLQELPAAMEAAQTKLALAQENVAKKEQAGEALAGRILREAKSMQAEVVATHDALVKKKPLLEQQRVALTQKRDALREKLSLKLEEKRRFADAQASLDATQARLQRAGLAVESAELRMQRMTIYSPIDGRVLATHASPGRRVNGLDPHSEQGSSAVVTLYDPHKLQVRVDVRLEDVPQVQLGQNAEIETASIPGGLTGEVISVTSLADIQKNTLQVKVAVKNPPDMLRPEMLAQVTFLSPERPEDPSTDSEQRLRILVPRSLVDSSSGSPNVWVADRLQKAARLQNVTLGRAGTEQLVEVTAGVTPTDKLISGGRESLHDGQRVSIVGEDLSLGMLPQTGSDSGLRTAKRQ